MDSLRKEVRVELTLQEIERLRNEFDDWKRRRDNADEKKQYETQLQVLHEVVSRALQAVEDDTRRIISDGSDVGTVYEACGLQEKRILWVRRVLWGYYREKFDQRDADKELRVALEAADDIVWSCYREPLLQVAPGQPLSPVPLAYIEPFHSPTALPRNEVPGMLKEKRLGDRFLADFFSQLPIPLVSLPPRCVPAPWWMVHIGHEVGHHLQHDLGLVGPFGELLFEVATTGPAPVEPVDKAQRWVDWSQEIFADVFSVFMMGATAVSAMAELETHPDPDMMLRKDSYPAPAVRLVLLAKVADLLGLDGTASLGHWTRDWWESRAPATDLENELLPELRADLAMTDKIANAVTTRTVGAAITFRTLTAWASGMLLPKGDRDGWQNALLNQDAFVPRGRLAEARIITSAGFGVWQKISRSDGPRVRRDASDRLRGRMLRAIVQNRDQATRAADPRVVPAVGALAAEISERLRHTESFAW